MKGLSYIDNSTELTEIPLDLTKFWKQTVTNPSNFRILGTELIVTLCGSFDWRTQAHLIGGSKTVFIANDDSDIFVINSINRDVLHCNIGWNFVEIYKHCTVVSNSGSAVIFFENYMRTYNFDSRYSIIGSEIYEQILTLNINDHSPEVFDVNLDFTSHKLYWLDA